MPPLSIESLPSNPNILPPLIVKKRGHLREKRIRKGALKRKQTRCTNCLLLVHNKRRCVAQPARNRRVERARDWDISSSESNSELERELAPFVEQARARARDDELDLSGLRSSDFEGLEGGITGAVGVETSGQDSRVGGKADGRVGDKEVEVEAPASPASPASPALQLRPKRARKVPARYRG
jgi:hypothetical protein